MTSKLLLKSADGTEWFPEDRPCPVCGSSRARKLGARGGRAHHEGKGAETNIVRCKDCGSTYTHPTLIPKTNPYEKESVDEYFQLHDETEKILIGEQCMAEAEEILGRTGRVLELGCGRGEFLRGAINRGWTAFGVDMTADFTKAAQTHGVAIESSSIEDCQALKQSYDVVVMVAILEHLYEPVKTLKRVSSALRPGGLLLVHVPNEISLTMRIGNLYMRARGRDWAINLSPTFSPFHVVGFSPNSLRKALNEAGFEIRTLKVHRYDNNLQPQKTIIQKLERLGLSAVQNLGQLFGMGDGLTCWAIRK